MFFFVFGITPLKKTGEKTIRHHCPRCNDIRNFQEMHSRQFFSFFFIPIIPVSKPTFFYACPTCSYSLSSEQVYDIPDSTTENTPEDSTPRIVVFCPRCEGAMYLPIREQRQSVTCPHCAMEFKVKGLTGDIPNALPNES